MFSAEAAQVGWVGGAMRVGHGVVDVAVGGGLVAAGESAGEVAGPDEGGQRCRGPVVRFGRQVGRVPQRFDGGAVVDELGQQRCGYGAAADDVPGRCRTRLGCRRGCRTGRLAGLVGGAGAEPGVGRVVQGGLLGEDVDGDVGRAGVGAGSRAVGVAAGAGQGLGSGGQGAEGVGAALGQGAGIVVADGVGQLGQAPVECGGIGGKQSAPQAGGAVFAVAGVDDNFAAAGVALLAPHGVGVVPVDQGVDGRRGLGRRQRPQTGGDRGERGVDGVQ
ncbi:hypothetical protein A5649_09750 [Mycolicibacter heraklionensis]|uniref:Uncharacterized protein n=1 Tax=Mycolicibacter heraklionensis TaxID=512402 RepID=A0AA91ERV9_9MYCO|nr:hypothetical protein A5649_09750 [Mycolicibacter heraklionensis]